GICAIPDNNNTTEAIKIIAKPKPIQLVYFTDPICSSCWGIEPQLRKLKLQYGHVIDIQYKMGGLLPDWSYNSGGIS
ncbi:DsbA family protein, partial [Klebsiella quasipneumoniae]|uniref:DsbA family protein n=1 Tax=Klebsiella quasipneumoniae TaxID=1463165 RepID=UPI00272F9BFF